MKQTTVAPHFNTIFIRQIKEWKHHNPLVCQISKEVGADVFILVLFWNKFRLYEKRWMGCCWIKTCVCRRRLCSLILFRLSLLWMFSVVVHGGRKSGWCCAGSSSWSSQYNSIMYNNTLTAQKYIAKIESDDLFKQQRYMKKNQKKKLSESRWFARAIYIVHVAVVTSLSLE